MTAPGTRPRPRSLRPIAFVARRAGWTDGQAYTAVIGVVVALTLALSALPAALQAKRVAGPRGATRVPAPRGTLTPVQTLGPPDDALAPLPVPLPLATPLFDVTPLLPVPEATSSRPPPGTIRTFAAVPAPGAPAGVATAADGTVYAATGNGTRAGRPGPSHIFGYAADGRPTRDIVVDGQPASSGDGLAGAAVDPGGGLVVLDTSRHAILRVDLARGAATPIAALADLPACVAALAKPPCEPGARDHAPSVSAALFDRHGNLYVTDPAQATIWRLAAGARRPVPWYQSLDLATGDGPTGLAWARDRGLLFTAGSTLDVANPNAGGLYRVTINADGTPGARTLVAKFGADARPGALAAGTSGTAYVVLRGTGSIASVRPDGTVSGRIDPPGTGPIAIDTPSALALRNGALFVANRAPATPARWAVLSIVVNDTPADSA